MKDHNKKYNDTLERVLNRGASIGVILCVLGMVLYWSHRPTAQTPAQEQPAKQKSEVVK